VVKINNKSVYSNDGISSQGYCQDTFRSNRHSFASQKSLKPFHAKKNSIFGPPAASELETIKQEDENEQE